MNTESLLKLAPVLAGIRLYHKHKVVGLEHLPDNGPVIIAANHSLASYDIALLMQAIYEDLNRVPRALIDRLFFKVPGLGTLMEAFGAREGNHDNAVKLLNHGDMVVIAPGGMREALRPSREKYKVIWGRRKGFVRLAIETGSPVVLAACPAADDLYDVFPSHITAWAYRAFKVPLIFAKGLGVSPLPKPIPLTHYLSEALVPPKKAQSDEAFAKQVDEFHAKIIASMENLMNEAVRHEEEAKHAKP